MARKKKSEPAIEPDISDVVDEIVEEIDQSKATLVCPKCGRLMGPNIQSDGSVLYNCQQHIRCLTGLTKEQVMNYQEEKTNGEVEE